MPVLMLMLITLLNDGTLITIGYDHAESQQTPTKWNLGFLFSMAAVQSSVALISSLVLLYCLLNSWEPGSLLQLLGVGGISYGKITSAIYLKVSVSDFLTLFSARSGGKWFFQVRPAPILIFGACCALTTSTILAMFWPKSTPDQIEVEVLLMSPPYALVVYVWTWSLAWWIVEDAAKVFCRWIAHKFNLLGVLSDGKMLMTSEALALKQALEAQALPGCGNINVSQRID